VDLTVVGPEGPLVLGVVDVFTQAGLQCFGPTRMAAQLEGSKVFSKDFLKRHHIPTAEYQSFNLIEPALEYLRAKGAPIVVKADGLAAGKGVVVAETLEQAEAAVRDMLAGNAFGSAGSRVVIEEFLAGEEASFIVMADGEHALALATSQDHKRVGDGDTGPNTGGMGRLLACLDRLRRGARTGDARGDPPHHQGHGRGRRALHRFPVRRPHDRPGRHAQGAGVQLPLRRPGDPAHHDAAEVRTW